MKETSDEKFNKDFLSPITKYIDNHIIAFRVERNYIL